MSEKVSRAVAYKLFLISYKSLFNNHVLFPLPCCYSIITNLNDRLNSVAMITIVVLM